ncbi:hypothetical protein [Ruania alba]|nr:hypothetical protein [Ruania alba]
MAALALPLGIAVALLGFATDDSSGIMITATLGLLLTAGLAIGGYRLAGASGPAAVAVPLLVLAVGAGVFVAEVALWLLLFNEESAVLAIIGIVAIPVLTIAGILGISAALRKQRAGR